MILRSVYHFAVREVRRSVVAAAAYYAGESLFDMKYGVRRNFAWRQAAHRDEIAFSLLFLPHEHVETNESFWNRVAARNRHPRAICGRTIDAAIPAHLSEPEMVAYVAAFARRLALQYNVGVLAAIHRPPVRPVGRSRVGPRSIDNVAGSSRNWHAHFLLSYCTVHRNGVLGRKQPLLDPNNCAHDRVMNFVDAERPEWARVTNEALGQAGCSDRVDHRSLLAQGSMDRPTKHMGPEASAAEKSPQPKKGFRFIDGRNHSRIGDYNRSVRALNQQRREQRASRADRLARFLAVKAAELKMLQTALDDKSALTIDLGSMAEGRKLLKHAALRRDYIRKVDRRHQLVFMNDGGCLHLDGRHLEILNVGTDAMVSAFAKAEGLTKLRDAVNATTRYRRTFLQAVALKPLLPDISELRRRYLDAGTYAAATGNAVDSLFEDTVSIRTTPLRHDRGPLQAVPFLPAADELSRLHGGETRPASHDACDPEGGKAEEGDQP